MKEIAYPAIFHVAEEGGFWVSFPDLGIVTQGDDLNEAILMASDCLLCYISGEDLGALPPPTPIEKVKNPDGEIIKMISPKYYNPHA